MSRLLRTLLAVAGAFILAWALVLAFPGFFGLISLRALDAQFRLRDGLQGRQPVDPSVVHVDIDDGSLEALPPALGRTALVTSLLEILTRCRVSAIGLDMVFTERDAAMLESGIARAVKESGAAYCPVVLRPMEARPRGEAPSGAEAPPQAYWGPAAAADRLELRKAEPGFSSAAAVLDAARGVGHINVLPDADGIYRRIPMFLRVGAGLVPALSLRMACGYLGVGADRVEIQRRGMIILRGAEFPDGRKRDVRIPVDRRGDVLIDLAGPWADSFPHYPAGRLLEAGKDPALLAQLQDEMEGDLVVLSDVSSSGKDYGPVALEEYFPLSGLHTAALSSILRGQFLSAPSAAIRVLATVLAAAVFILLALRLRGAPFLLAAAAAILLLLAAGAALFIFARVWLDITPTALGMLFAAAAVAASTFLDQEREKAAFRARIEHYFSPLLLKKILDRPVLLEGCEKKVLTVLFSDISGFTTWSSHQQPEDIRLMLNEYFEEMAGIIFSFEGTIDKYIGDGMLAFYGDPVEQRDHAERAVLSAVAMQRKVAELRRRWEAVGGLPITIRIGINTGEVIAGNMGSARRLDYTVIGSNVNLASRLESGARPGQVLVSKATRDALPPSILLQPAATISAKGFSDPVEVFSVEIL